MSVLSLAIFFSPLSFAKVQQWDFESKEDYHFDPEKIQMLNGSAQLKRLEGYKDYEQVGFDLGKYDLNTWAANGNLELSNQSISQKPGKYLPSPVGEKTPGVMALWNFDEPSGSNLLDPISRNVAKSSDVEIVSGQNGFGYARLFDGKSSHIFIPPYETIYFPSAFSVEAWIRPVTTANGREQTIVSKWQTIGAQKGFALQVSPEGKIDFIVSADGATSVHHTGDTVLVPGLWYHVVAVSNGSDLRLYLNGAPDNLPTPFRGPIRQTSLPIYVGALIDNKLDQFFEGVIDQVAFYNRAMTETEAMSHYGNPQGLIAYWKLDESNGVLQDDSGYGHTLTARENPTYGGEGKYGTSIFFDGKMQYLDTPTSFHLTPDGALSVEAWIYPESLPASGKATIISSYAGGSDFSFSLDNEGHLIAISPSTQPSQFQSSKTLTPQNWQQVAVTWGNGQVSFYIQGQLDSSQSYEGVLKTTKAGIRIGMDASGTSAFHGSIDEVSLLRRVKSLNEMAASSNLFPLFGVYTSSVKDAGSSAPWQNLSWQEAIPYGEPIPSYAKGLIHLYHLDETAESTVLLDAKDLEIPLGFMGTYPVPGVLGNARWFAKPGYDKIISQKKFPALSTFSLLTWFQFASSEPGTTDRLFSIGDENPSVYRSGPDGFLHVVSSGAKKIVSKIAVKNTEWHHLALTADGRQIFLYVDGILQGSAPFTNASAEDPMVLGNLKSSDTFRGAMDDFALINSALDVESIQEIVRAARMDVKFLVRSSDDSSFQNVSWRGPKGANYLEREAGPNTVGLWHFNEAQYRGQSQEVLDASRFVNHGVAYGNVVSSSDGVLNASAQLNGAGDYIEVSDSESLKLRDELTLSAWIRPIEIQQDGVRIIDKRFQGGAPTFSSYALELTPANRLALRLGHSRGFHLTATDLDGEIAVGKWNHVAATYNGSEIRLYINGVLKKTETYREEPVYDGGSLFIGRYGSASGGYFRGMIDEVAVDNRALSGDEIANLFALADPENYFKNSEANKLAIPHGRYFQYKAFLSTSFPSATPSVKSVIIQGNDYPGEKPSITNGESISFADLSMFKEKTTGDHRGAITYQLSKDGSNWFYHNGRHWVIATTVVESNTAEQISQRIADFSKEVGIGSFYFKAFLHSPSGVEQSVLDSVEVEYLPNKLTMTSPNGAEDWLVGSDQTITWNSAGEVVHVSLEYSKDDFKEDFHTIATQLANNGSFTWKVPDETSPNIKIRVMDSLDPRIYDTSDLSFRIVGAFEVVSPNWNERWIVNEPQKITWRTLGNVPDVKLDFSTDNFKKEIFPIVDSIKNEGSYDWIVPDHISKAMKVRVSDVHDSLTFDQSNDTFVVAGKFEFLEPKVNTRFPVNSEASIKWKTTGSVAMVKLEYQTSLDAQDKKPWRVVEEAWSNRGSYLWKVPDQVDGDVKFRISDPADPKTFSESETFAITGGFKLLAPKGDEHWTVGSKRKIVWETSGTVPTVTLEYAVTDPNVLAQSAVDPFKTGLIEWKTIEKDIPNTGNFIWEVPDILSQNVLVRVIDSRDPFVSSANPSPIRVVPGFLLKAPNGGEGLRVGGETDIEWETKGTMSNVKLEYSKDNFKSDIHEIIGKASNIDRFRWVVPDDPAKEVWIRISDPSSSQAADISDKPFRIFGDFRLMSPAGGEKFEVGSLATLEWKTFGSVPKVKIEYSHDNFNKDARIIAESAENKGQFSWSVPDDIGFDYYLRISDVNDPSSVVISPAPFSIVGKFYLSHPAGGENFTVGTKQKISWKGAGSIAAVRIDYSEDDFKKSFQTIAQAAPNSGTFDWEAPNRIGKSFKLRIWDPAHPDSVYIMDKASRIIGGFTLSSPNGGEVLYVGDKVSVTWKTYGNLERVRLEFSDDDFTKHIWLIADTYQNIDQYQWMVPSISSGNYRVRISDPNDATAYDISNSDFRIRSRIQLISPVGGEGWKVGETRKIEWKTTGNVPQVHIEYSNDDFKTATTIAEFEPNVGVYEWVVPNHVTQNLRVRVSDANDIGAYVVSNSSMRIQGVIDLTSPQGDEVWRVGQSYPITWKTVGDVKGVRIEFSRDGFMSEAEPIIESTVNNGFYNWTVPDKITKNAKIRVVDVADASAQGITKQPFQIAASFMVLGPNGGESWHAMERREVSWVTVGTVPEVDLSYCLVETENLNSDKCDAKKTKTIDRDILNAGKFMWDIPKEVGANFRLQVCDSKNPEICDISDKTFSLSSPFEIVYPRSSESWQVGSEQEIRWHTYGTVSRIFVDYATLDSKNALNAPKSMITWKRLGEDVPNEGHYLFNVPDDISQNVVFRISDYSDEELFSISPAAIQFVGAFTLLGPNGGERWSAGSAQTISWKNNGTISNVRLEYSKDDFKNDINLIEAKLNNTSSYKWTLPADQGASVKIRVMDADNPSVFDASDKSFKMMPAFVLIAPAGGEAWRGGSKQTLQWKTIGKVENVRIEYQNTVANPDEDAAQPSASVKKLSWLPVVTNLANGGAYEWLITNDVASQKNTRIRISDAADPDAFQESAQSLSILSDFQIVSPKPDEVLIVDQGYKVQWTTFGKVPSVRIEYGVSEPGKADQAPAKFQSVENFWANTGSYFWTVPDDIHEKVWLKISDANEHSAFRICEAAFKIRGSLQMDLPEAKINWAVGSTQTLSWNTVGTIPNVNLEYRLPEKMEWKTIASGIHNTGNYGWLIPNDVAKSIHLRVSASGNPYMFHEAAQTINISPQFKFLSPAGGEKLIVGREAVLKWENLGEAKNVILEYSVGQDWLALAGPIPNTQTYNWTIPDDISQSAKIKLIDVDNSEAFIVSEPFKIAGELKLTAPVVSEVWNVASEQKIAWDTVGSIPRVKIEFIRDGVAQEIKKDIPNQGSFAWIVPDVISDAVKIRISDIRDASTQSQSPENFSVIGTFDLISPASSEDLTVGSEKEIAWTSYGKMDLVNIDFSRDGFVRDIQKIAAQVPNNGLFLWKVQDMITKNGSVRISDAKDPRAFVMNKTPFGISGALVLTAPGGGDIWTVGTKQVLTWETTGTISKVAIEFSRDDFQKDIQVIENALPNQGTYDWTIPDVISANLKVRVVNAEDSAVKAVSNPLKIVGAIHLRALQKNETLNVYGEQLIDWETSGTIPKVRIDYSRDSFNQDIHVISAEEENKGFYKWTIPDDIGPDVRVRISDVRNLAVFDLSSVLQIQGVLSFIGMQDSARWAVGSKQDISWNALGTIPHIRIEYSKDDFKEDIHLIADQLENRNKFVWTVPDDISDKVRFRVSDVRSPEVQAVTNDPYSIVGTIQVTQPFGKSISQVGRDQVITWKTKGTIPQVRLEYSAEPEALTPPVTEISGETLSKPQEPSIKWVMIAASVQNTGSYVWKVPDQISNHVLVRVTDSQDVQVFGVSPEAFSIIGDLKLTSPLGGERWIVQSDHDLTWDTNGTIPEVTLEFSRDHFKEDIQIIAERIINKGNYVWNIPDMISDKVEIRIRDPRDERVSSTTGSAISIIGDFIFITPANPVSWRVGSDQKIEWQTVGTIPEVRLEYAMPSKEDGGQEEFALIQDRMLNQGEFVWRIPDAIGNGIKLRLSNAKDLSTTQVSNPLVQIDGVIRIIGPEPLEKLTVGDSYRIAWETQGTLPRVAVEFSRDDFQQEIIAVQADTANENKFFWTVPDMISDKARVRVRSLDNPAAADASDYFEIRGKLHFFQPSGDKIFRVGEIRRLEWQSVGTIPAVNLTFSTDNFASDVRIIQNQVENTGSFDWTVTDAIADEVFIRVTDARDSTVFSVHEVPIAIQGTLTLLAPTGREKMIVGSKQMINWQKTGTIPAVNIEYSYDDFQRNVVELGKDIANTGNFEWEVPDFIREKVWMRISDSQNPAVFSKTSNPFKIQGDIEVLTSQDESVWVVGQTETIEWKTTGGIPQVRLEYSTDEFQNDINVIYDAAPNQGQAQWVIPDSISSHVRLRVMDSKDPQVVGYSVKTSKIQGNFQFTSPAGGEKWIVGKDQAIQWKSFGTIPKVALEYSSDGFQKDIRLIEKLADNQNRYLWKVPDGIGAFIQVRVRDAADEAVQAVSEPFSILGDLHLVKPQGGDVWTVGSEKPIQWQTIGTIPQVALEYSLDQFKSDIRFIEKVANNSGTQLQTYLWKVPDAISDRVWVRARDIAENSEQTVTSDAFKISGQLKLISPAGGEVLKVGSPYDLVWKTVGTVEKVRLEYSRDGFKKEKRVIADALENQGTYHWTVSDAISERVWIRVVDSRDDSVVSISEQPFAIQGELKLKSPVGGEILQVGSQQVIEWETVGTISDVRLELIPVEDKNQKVVVENILLQSRMSNLGKYSWKIPDKLPRLVKFRISDASNSGIFSESQFPVKIQGAIHVLTPNKPIMWAVGSTQEITWQTSGFMPEVKIEYSRDHFQSDIGTLYPLVTNTGSIKWVVQDLIAKNFEIRVVDPENPEVYGLSPEAVEIVGAIKVLSPAGGERFEVGKSVELRWQTTGTIAQVKIEFSRDKFARASMLAAEDLSNIGRYVWQVPDQLSQNTWIKISDQNNPKVFGISEIPFAITGGLELTSPQGGEILSVRDEARITWQTTGGIQRVRLEYSTDDFVTATPISGLIVNEGSFNWRVPDIVSDRLKVRVLDAQDDKVFSASRAPIKIQGGFVFVNPSGGEFWKVGTQQTINWQTLGTIPYVSLDYSTDNFATSVPIIMGLANKNGFSWTIPDISADQIQLRISNAEDQSVFALTSQPVRVGGSIEFISPIGGEVWKVGDEQEIKWKSTGTIPRVRLEISSDQFDKQIQSMGMSIENTGSYKWRVPDWITNGLQFRVSDARNQAISDVTDAPFKIVGGFNLISPKGGEVWKVGSSQPISWTTNGSIPSIRLEYSRDNFLSVMPIAAEAINTGNFMWDIPDLAGSSVRIRVSDAKDPSVNVASIYAVEIQGGLNISAPSGNQVWSVGSQQLITWQTNGTIPNVNLQYSDDDFNTAVSIANAIANTGSFSWTVPNIDAKNLKIRVLDSTHTDVYTETQSTVKVQGRLTITNPQGGEVLMVGTKQTISWESVGRTGDVRLEYSTDNFKSSLPIAASAPNSGQFEWEIPDDISKNIRIRIVSIDDPSIKHETEKPIEIRGALALASPSGGEIWQVGGRYAIMWNTLGSISQVKLEYSRDDFKSDLNVIDPGIANKGIHYWEVPSIIGSEFKIRVSDTQNPNVFDVSRAPFQVAGLIELLYPNWGETLKVGDRVDIQWKSTPNISQVKIEYSMDQFETSKVITQAAANSGKFSWSVPDEIVGDISLRIADAQNASVFAISKAPFRIRGALMIDVPRGDVLWPVGSEQTVTWRTMGTIPEIRIEYSGDDFASSLPIAAKTVNTGRLLWRVPEMTQKNIKIRISDPRELSVQAVSQGNITVVGGIRLISPNGGEKWVTNEERIIRWETSGYIPKVVLEYSKDNFVKDIVSISTDTHNIGSYFWKVPNDPSNQIKVRVRSQDDTGVSSESKLPFEIGLYKVNWIVRDAKTHDHLGGLVITDSTGKTQTSLNSPVTLEYPYGIFTTAWSKPGYQEFRTTWLADQDRTFTVYLEPTLHAVEVPRVNFEYDRDKDLMKVTSWYEKNGKPVPAVIFSEVRIYEGARLVKTISSSTPDSFGYFRMIWDTSAVEGNSRYLASVVINTASGQSMTSPMSYQIDIPVKEMKFNEPSKSSMSSLDFEPQPVSTSSNSLLEEMRREIMSPAKVAPSSDKAAAVSESKMEETPLLESRTETPVKESQEIIGSKLSAPEKAVINETISINYQSQADARPVIDVYDASRRLIVRGQEMKMTSYGQFSFLLPIKGVSFIPGKSITVTVIERKTGQFKSAEIQIQSANDALGYSKEVGNTSVLNLIHSLDRLIQEIRSTSHGKKQTQIVMSFESTLTQLAATLGEDSLNPMIFEKLNQLAAELSKLITLKGYDAGFLTQTALGAGSSMDDLNAKMREFQAAVAILYRSTNSNGY